MSSTRKTLRQVVLGVGVVFFGFLLADALGVFKSEPYTAISHGSHVHVVPDDRDDGVDAASCPQRRPGPDEFISPQCQMVRTVQQANDTYYVPEQAAPGIPVTQFPTRRPGSGEVITPQGQLIRSADHQQE